MDMPAVVHQLQDAEGLRLTPYPDSGGQWVIGYGHLLTRQDHLRVGSRITPGRAQALLLDDIAKAQRACERLWPAFSAYPDAIQRSLLEVAFLTGEQKLKRFVALRAAVEREDWPAAAQALTQSKLARQVKRRAARLVQQIRLAGGPHAR